MTGSGCAAAWVAVFIYAPAVLGPAAGMIADRMRRRTMLLIVNAAAGAIMPLLLFVHSAGQVWLIYLVMLGYGLAAILIDPAESALFAVMLPDPVRQRFNGLRLTVQEGGKLVAPLAGALAMVISGIASPARFSRVDALHRPPSFLGLLAGALGAGSILAGLTSGRVIARFGERRLALFGLLNGVFGNLLLLIGTIPTALAGSFVAGFALPWTVLAVINLSQRRTPDALQGRVAAALTLALFAPQPLAHLAGALAVDHVSYRLLFLASAAATLATAAWLYRRP